MDRRGLPRSVSSSWREEFAALEARVRALEEGQTGPAGGRAPAPPGLALPAVPRLKAVLLHVFLTAAGYVASAGLEAAAQRPRAPAARPAAAVRQSAWTSALVKADGAGLCTVGKGVPAEDYDVVRMYESVPSAFCATACVYAPDCYYAVWGTEDRTCALYGMGAAAAGAARPQGPTVLFDCKTSCSSAESNAPSGCFIADGQEMLGVFGDSEILWRAADKTLTCSHTFRTANQCANACVKHGPCRGANYAAATGRCQFYNSVGNSNVREDIAAIKCNDKRE